MTRKKGPKAVTGSIEEFRVVCARFHEPGHRQHAILKKTMKAAEDCVEAFAKDVARLPDRTPSLFYIQEYPKRIQVRTVTPWVDA